MTTPWTAPKQEIAPGEYELGLRERARDLRRKFFERPDNDNAPSTAPSLVKTVSTEGRTWPPKEAPLLPMVACRGVVKEGDIRRVVGSIIWEVAEKHGFSYRELIGKGNFRHISEARFEAYWRIRVETNLSFPEIGRHFGGRHHTTVLYGLRRHEERMKAESAA